MATAFDLEFLQSISSGPSSTVFVARDRVSGREVVVKQMPFSRGKASGNSDAHQELEVARALRRVSPHPNLVVYNAAFVKDDELFLVMDVYAGGDLYSFLESQPNQRLDEEHALEIWQQIVHAVHYLHQQGIAHRDLSLENILLDSQGVPKVCDFGLSVFVDKGGLVTGQVGKAYYMAPEVVAGAQYDAYQADVWSLGVMLFILLTGSPIVQVATATDPVFRALPRVGVYGILRLWKMENEVSPRCIRLLDRMLQVCPTQRAKSPREVLEML